MSQRDYTQGGGRGQRDYSQGGRGQRDYSQGGGRDYSQQGGRGGGRDYSQGGGRDYSQQGGRGGGRDYSQGGGRDYSSGGRGGGRDYSQGGGRGGGRDYSSGGGRDFGAPRDFGSQREEERQEEYQEPVAESYTPVATPAAQPQAAATAPVTTIAPSTTTPTSAPIATSSSAGGAPQEGRRQRFRDTDVQNLPSRPIIAADVKQLGRPVQLGTNHFRFLIGDKVIYQYAVKFRPEIISKRTRFQLLRTHSALLGHYYVFDGAMLFLQKAVPDQELPTPLGDKTVVVELAQTRELDPNSADIPEQLYNIIFKKILYLLELKPIGRQHYNPKRAKAVTQHKVELWPGYFTSIGASDIGTMLNVDFTHKILRTDTVLDYFYELSNKSRNWKDLAAQELNGQVVLTRYGNTERTYRVDEIDWDRTPADQFPKDGKTVSYEEYYERVYGLKIADRNQPLLLCRKQRRGQEDQIIYLIPELCSMTGLTEQMRSDFHVMRDISRHTRVPPDVRCTEIEAFVKAANTSEAVRKEFGEWKIHVDDKMLSINGRSLDPEKILFQNARPFSSPDASWGKMNRDLFIQPVSLKEWLLVFTKRDERNADVFIETFQKVAQPCGVNVAEPFTAVLNDDQSRTYVNAIRSNITPNTQLVVCILPTSKKERYDDIKKACCVQTPIPSQCVVAKSLAKNTMSVITKIMFQINCKLGGQLWRLEIPVPKAMVIGMDVCHDTAKGKRSVAGFCASLNASFTQYYSRVSFQDSRQEVIDGLKVCVSGALAKYYKVNNMLPERIIVYRDGVGDGMLKAVVEHELPQYYAAFASINENYKPKLAVVIVKKRIHTRLFASIQGRLSNPPPGTIVDSGATHKGWYDFFLVSQSVREGTVTPTHYHVITDDTGLRPDYLQTLTFKMCHLYYNWPGTIRVPAPCQYAHKISFLAAQSLHEDPAEVLRDKLYYL